MNSKVIAACIVSGLVIVAGGLFILTKEQSEDQSSTLGQPLPYTNETPVDAKINQPFTKNEVSEHNSKTDCWTIIDGSVYDITDYIPRHPGGDNILSACGEDGTEFFAGEKSGQEGGTNDHSNSAKSQLAKLKVGELAQ